MKLASFLLRPCWIGKNTVCCCVWINCLSRRLCVHILENMDGRISTLKGFIFFNCLFFFCWVFPYAAGKVPIPGSFSPFYLLLFFFFFFFLLAGRHASLHFYPTKMCTRSLSLRDIHHTHWKTRFLMVFVPPGFSRSIHHKITISFLKGLLSTGEVFDNRELSWTYYAFLFWKKN